MILAMDISQLVFLESRVTIGRHDLEKSVPQEGKMELVRPPGLAPRLLGTVLGSGTQDVVKIGS